MPIRTTRRELFAAAAALPAAVQAEAPPPMVERHDQSLTALLQRQVTDPSHPSCGAYADAYGMISAGAAGGIIDALSAAFLCPQSRYYKDASLLERLRLAAGFLNRVQHPNGTIDLLITNFHSPPDTGFVVHGVATAACLAQRAGAREIVALLEPFLVKAGGALAVGGVHTPNHRGVVSSAMAQINEVFPDARYLKRIEQWLAEGIDIDADGQFDERSTTIYNTVSDRALTVLALKLKRPELLDPVRRNLDAMIYLLHPDYEVVTEISHRQDRYQRGDMSRYWFPLRYLAALDRNGRYATLAQSLDNRSGSLSAMLEYPEMLQLPAAEPLPDNYEKFFAGMNVARIRRGAMSATLLLEGDSRFFSVRKGAAVVQAVRFATAFFGKGQFSGVESSRDGKTYVLAQPLLAPYYQPFDPPRKVAAGEWSRLRSERKQSDICTLRQTALITEAQQGFRLRLKSEGTRGVPLAVEINLREGGKLDGCLPVDDVKDAYLLGTSAALYTAGADTIRFGPGVDPPHTWTQIRGAAPKLPGTSVYITGYTPFDHTIDIECG